MSDDTGTQTAQQGATNDGTGNAGAGTTAAGSGSGSQTTFTQEQLDKIVGERLAKERSKYGDYDALRTKASEFDKITEAQKTDLQKLEERATKAEGRIPELEVTVLRYQVAAEKGIPLNQAHRLQGATKEDMGKDADELLKVIKPGAGGSGGNQDFGGGARGGTATGNTMDDLIRQGAGRG